MNFQNSIEIILYKTFVDIRSEMQRSYLGLVWWIIEPVLYLAAFYTLFVLIMKRASPDFVPMFLCGAIVWKWFDSGLKSGCHSITANRQLLQQVYVPKYIFPAIAVFGSTARFIPVFAIFAIFLLLYGVHLSVTWLAIPLIMFTQLIFVMAMALLVGAFTPFVPDFRVAIDNGMMVLFFISGVFFNVDEVHEPMRTYLLLNPMAGLIVEYRNVMLHGIWPNLDRLIIVLVGSSALGIVALRLLHRLDRKYSKVRF